MTTACPSPALGAQPPPSSSQEQEPRSGEPSLLWLANLTGADIGLPPIPQDPGDRCTIWENLVSLVDFQCPGEFPLTSEEIGDYIHIPRASSSSSSSAGTVPPPQAAPWSPPPSGDIDYKSDPHVKPPYSYATLICMAMEASHQAKLTLADICKWIRDNFSYFRRAHPSWQSSIRHNLCINKRFVKVPREKGEPGRGAYWKLHPQYAEWLKTSSSEGRKALPEQTPPASGKRAPQPARRAPSPARSPQGGLEVGAELQRLLREFEEFESSHNCEPLGDEEGQQWPEPCPTPEGQQWPQPCPAPPAPVPALPGCAPGNPEEPGELTELKGSADWEALFSPCLEPDFSALDHLELPSFSPPEFFPLEAPGEQAQPQGEQQIRPEPGLAKPGSEETRAAAAILEAAWNEEITENLPSCFPLEQGDENLQASLSSTDLLDWDSLDPFKSLLEFGDEMKFDWI